MSTKRKSQRKKQVPLQKLRPLSPLPIGLEPGEIGVIFDPTNPVRVDSYMLPDGTRFKLNNSSVPAQVPPLEPSLMVTSMANRGERNTLAWRFGDMMIMAQELFGPRDMSWLYLGYEFVPIHARVRYVTEFSLVIQLSFQAMRDPLEAYSELAHECIHLLSPNPYLWPPILEEGMATCFSTLYLNERMNIPTTSTEHKQYDEARDLVAKLLEIDPYGIRKMRDEEPFTRRISKSLILKYYPSIPEADAARLVQPFILENYSNSNV